MAPHASTNQLDINWIHVATLNDSADRTSNVLQYPFVHSTSSPLIFFGVLAVNNFAGLAVSNSIGGVRSYICRTQAQWNSVAKDAKAAGFGSIRIEAFDCNALDMASSAAAAVGLKVMAGIYVSGTMASGSTQINNDVQAFRAAYKKYGAGRYVGLTVGNEVNDSPANIMAKVNDVRGYLRSVGVNTPVSTVHVWVNIRNDPCLCSSDFVGANAHAFYDGSTTSSQAGSFLFKTLVPSLKAKCPGKKVYITETGWPSRGGQHGAAVASPQDEQTALQALNCASVSSRNVSVYAFKYDDQVWKSNDNERSFGFNGKINLGAVFSDC